MTDSQMVISFKQITFFNINYFPFLFKINHGVYWPQKLIWGTFEDYSKILNPFSQTTQYVNLWTLGANCKLVSNTTKHINLPSPTPSPATRNLLTLWPHHKKHDRLKFRVFLSIRQCTFLTLIIFHRYSQSPFLASLLIASGEKQPTRTETARETPLIGSWELELSGMI